MQINVNVVSVEHNIEIEKKGGGVYPGSRLTYRFDGKVQEQCFHNNSLKYNPKLAEQLKEIKPGDNVIIDKIKDGDFWKINSVIKSNQEAKTETKSYAAPKSNYETPEERAKRQVMIVRQSSLSTAVSMLAANGGKKNTKEEVVGLAKYFESYVLDLEFDEGGVESLQDDIPF